VSTPLAFNAFDHFVNVIFQGMDTGRIIMSLEGIEAYFDESGTHAGSPLLIVAGYISTEALWKRFRKAWAEFLVTHCDADTYFHAKDRIKENEDRTSRKAVAIIHKSIVVGLAVTLKESDFDDLVTPVVRSELGDAYDFCCQVLYESMVMTPEVHGLKGKILYVFEQGAPRWKKARARMEKIQCLPVLKEMYRYKNHVFMTKAEAPPLQAADLFANLLFKTYRDHGNFEPESLHPALLSLFDSSHRHQEMDRTELKKTIYNSLPTIDHKKGTSLAAVLAGWYPGEPTEWEGKTLQWK
jgi:hypothetical protein